MKYLCKCYRNLPFVLSIGAPISFLLTYGIAVGNDHVSWLWPYISDTGTLPPENCIFSLLLNSFSFILIGVIYLKYRIVSELVKYKETVNIKSFFNKMSAIFGYLSCFGLIIVANFEETSQVVVHISGAIGGFSFGILYFITQTIFTYKIDPLNKRLFWIRTILTISSIVSTACFLGPIKPAMENFTGDNFLKWTSQDGGYGYHLTSTFFEWILMLSYAGFCFTFYFDFRKVQIIPPQIKAIYGFSC
ncbi:conserved hypothetical protein [Pediculus humanus corporis]|uniref:CWH43-like N-terminal domain-containing protein n=1 Tax=Pediculus humanus subsp. corporis TaxID=121224 RepID=E0VD67_PEDHC|nr:uncharacterized protein Phum_PHUM106000 [Pediculus humanus corporis]EEB11323.1 conserved hypothetical protein [Pediculus humanus corporis]